MGSFSKIKSLKRAYVLYNEDNELINKLPDFKLLLNCFPEKAVSFITGKTIHLLILDLPVSVRLW